MDHPYLRLPDVDGQRLSSCCRASTEHNPLRPARGFGNRAYGSEAARGEGECGDAAKDAEAGEKSPRNRQKNKEGKGENIGRGAGGEG